MTRVDKLVRLAEMVNMEDKSDEVNNSEQEAIADVLGSTDCELSLDDITPQEVVRYLEMSRNALAEYEEEVEEVKYIHEYTEHKLDLFGSYVTDESFIDTVEFKLASLESRLDKLERYIKVLKYNITMLEYLDEKLSTKEVM